MRNILNQLNPFLTTRSLPRARSRGGFSLMEMLVIVAVIGVLTAISIPVMTNMIGATEETKDRENAQRVETLSASLAALGVAHVIPQSMGGVEATVKLLRKGVTITDPIVPERVFQLGGLTDNDVGSSSFYLEIVYDSDELRLRYNGNPI